MIHWTKSKCGELGRSTHQRNRVTCPTCLIDVEKSNRTVTRGEIIEEILQASRGLTFSVTEMHAAITDAGWVWRHENTRNVLNYLARNGKASKATGVKPVRGRAPGCPSYRKIQTFQAV